MRAEASTAAGLLTGVRVVELAHEATAYTGWLFATLGADVVLVEPPGGHPTRHYGPVVDGSDGHPVSLWWERYHSGKSGVTVDLQSPQGRAAWSGLVLDADVVLEAETRDGLDALGIGPEWARRAHPDAVWLSMSRYGAGVSIPDTPVVDLVLSAAGGQLWMCGYDDHSVPPVRAGEHQALHTAGVWGLLGTLVALVARSRGAPGQVIDLDMTAAVNITTEGGSYEWLVHHATLERQMARHAAAEPTTPTLIQGSDGRFIHSSLPPRTASQLRTLRDWLDESGLRARHEETFWLDVAIERGGVDIADIGADVEVTAIVDAARQGIALLASSMPAATFFVEAQQRGLACGVVLTPDQVISDAQMHARNFPTPVWHEDLGRWLDHPGPPFRADVTRVDARLHAPTLGEDDAAILGRGD